jgi:UDP-2,3-diacylglucosamine pyrophosphatase LpxH
MINGILYCNDGDWVESLTTLVEHQDGRLEILSFDEVNQMRLNSHPQEAVMN